jgi:hypothetical protein
MADDKHDYKVGLRCTPGSEKGSPTHCKCGARTTLNHFSAANRGSHNAADPPGAWWVYVMALLTGSPGVR